MAVHKNSVCLRHISEVYLYEYYASKGKEYEISTEDTLTVHKEAARKLEAISDPEKALQEWTKAYYENPVDMESILGIISCCKQLGDVDGEYFYTNESYSYCCTRAELAAFYRNLGWYYLEKYKPDVAASCYTYSQFFEKTKQAENEIKFLEEALKRKFNNTEIHEIQKIFKDNDIPTQASSVTLALLYKAGEEAESAGQTGQALDCYRMVFDLTQDEEVGNRISKLI